MPLFPILFEDAYEIKLFLRKPSVDDLKEYLEQLTDYMVKANISFSDQLADESPGEKKRFILLLEILESAVERELRWRRMGIDES